MAESISLSYGIHLLAWSIDVVVDCYVRSYMMLIMGNTIFADKSARYIHMMFLPLLEDLEWVLEYSSGSAALTWLYREFSTSTLLVSTR